MKKIGSILHVIFLGVSVINSEPISIIIGTAGAAGALSYGAKKG